MSKENDGILAGISKSESFQEGALACLHLIEYIKANREKAAEIAGRGLSIIQKNSFCALLYWRVVYYALKFDAYKDSAFVSNIVAHLFDQSHPSTVEWKTGVLDILASKHPNSLKAGYKKNLPSVTAFGSKAAAKYMVLFGNGSVNFQELLKGVASRYAESISSSGVQHDIAAEQSNLAPSSVSVQYLQQLLVEMCRFDGSLTIPFGDLVNLARSIVNLNNSSTLSLFNELCVLFLPWFSEFIELFPLSLIPFSSLLSSMVISLIKICEDGGSVQKIGVDFAATVVGTRSAVVRDICSKQIGDWTLKLAADDIDSAIKLANSTVLAYRQVDLKFIRSLIGCMFVSGKLNDATLIGALKFLKNCCLICAPQCATLSIQQFLIGLKGQNASIRQVSLECLREMDVFVHARIVPTKYNVSYPSVMNDSSADREIKQQAESPSPAAAAPSKLSHSDFSSPLQLDYSPFVGQPKRQAESQLSLNQITEHKKPKVSAQDSVEDKSADEQNFDIPIVDEGPDE